MRSTDVKETPNVVCIRGLLKNSKKFLFFSCRSFSFQITSFLHSKFNLDLTRSSVSVSYHLFKDSVDIQKLSNVMIMLHSASWEHEFWDRSYNFPRKGRT